MRNYYRDHCNFLALCRTGLRHTVNEYWEIAYLSRLQNSAQKVFKIQSYVFSGKRSTYFQLAKNTNSGCWDHWCDFLKASAFTESHLWSPYHNVSEFGQRLRTWSAQTKNFTKLSYAWAWKVQIMLYLHFVSIKPRFLSIVANRQYERKKGKRIYSL